jgi:peptidoglycan/xylan/chitin deacetylase (PgdA/CDA1 family)
MGIRIWQWAVLGSVFCLGQLTGFAADAAPAANCPGHPDALGTSRTLVVDPKEHPRIGGMQYAETLPLEDHEVVLTFDDGPLPRNSNQVLDILASQCVKATFFIIGRMAQAYPQGVRKLRDAGHTIGTHTQDHPLSMNKMPIERARQEIDDGIASVTSALGDNAEANAGPAPFFRIPGLLRAEIVEDYLASRGIQTWSTDFLANDWRHISSSRVVDFAVKRLEEKKKGILLLHDIQARTVAALPKILHELKARGYRIVHVVPASAELPATATEPVQWQLHPMPETASIAHWPNVPSFATTADATLPAPSLVDLGLHDGKLTLAEPTQAAGAVSLAPEASPWPTPAPLAPDRATIALPVPSPSLFEEKRSVAVRPLTRPSHRAEQSIGREADSIANLISADAEHIRRK